MTHEKIMDRIRKLLAMSRDTGSVHEAAIAARRARNLMDEYQINEMDLSVVSESDMGGNTYETGMARAMKPISGMAVAVAKFNDCNVTYEKIGRFQNLRFEGMLVDSVCAVELMKYLRGEMYRQAEQQTRGHANRHAFRLGFAGGIVAQVAEAMKEREQIKTSNGTALVVCKKQLVEEKFGVARYSRKRNTYSGERSTFDSGYAAGKATGLNRQVSGSGQARLR